MTRPALTFALASLAWIHCNIQSHAAPASGSLFPGGAAAWKLIWNEEFDGPDAKLDERWISRNGPSGHILCSRWRENAVVKNGTLRLVNKKENRGGQDWTSGSILTKEKFLYGYFECRYRHVAAEGTNKSFRLMTQNKEKTAKGKNFDIAILDVQYNFAREFPTYGLERNEMELVFYFNGKAIRREKKTFCLSESPVWLSLRHGRLGETRAG